MTEHTEIGIDGCHDVFAVSEVHHLKIAGDAVQGLVRDIVAVWFHEGTKELHSMPYIADMQLAHVQLQT